ncbi:MAG: tetratricopeptide repeat protein [Campylobacterales bacterium]|nr:tetratricopeptide repeat protein [Campylobacterales bacterium]
MKKVFFVIMFMLPVYILALDVEQTYSQAMDAYRAKDFQTSYELFSKLYLTKLSDTNLNFNLGMSAYETGHYENALAAFERVEMLDPTNLRNKLEKARTYFMLKMYEDSELSFREVLANPMIPENVRKNIELYLSKVTKVQEKSFTYLTVAMDMLYDSNINYGPMDDSYTIGNTKYATSDKKSDIALQVLANIVNVCDIGEANGFAIKNRATVYLNSYQKESAYDTKYFAYVPSLLYKYTKYTAEMAAGADTITLANKDYLQTFFLMPRVEYEHTNTLRSSVYFKYQTKKFQQLVQSDLDANHYEVSYGLQNILSPRSYAQVNVTGIQEKKEHGIRVDVNYNEYKLDAIYANQFTPTYGGELYAQIRERKYDDYSALFNATREDIGKSIGASVSAKVMETLRVKFKTNYDRVDSNQNVFSYEKYTVSLGVVQSF